MSNEQDEGWPSASGGEPGQTEEFPAQGQEGRSADAGWQAWQPPPPPPPGAATPPGPGTAGAAYPPGTAQPPGSWGYGPGDLGWGQPSGGHYGPAGGPYGPTAREAAWPRRRRHGWAIAGGVAAALVIGTVGGLVGHAIDSSKAAPVSSAAGNNPAGSGGFEPGTGTGSGSGSGNGSGFPFGSGSEPGSGSGTGGYPFGGSGSSGTAPSSGGTGPTDASSIAARVDPGLVDINTTVDYGSAEAAGTGMVLTSNGEVLTNNHVIDGATSISVTDVGNGRTYGAKVVGYSVTKDVAILQLTGASGLQTVTIASSAASVGEEVVGIGNAGGSGGTPSYAGGTVTATNQSITASDELTGTDENLTGMIATNADIQSGDSGGPLVNASGQVIGMDTAGSDTSGQFGAQSGGSGYAIPISTATSIGRQITAGLSSSTVHVGATAFLGVGIGGSESGSGFGGSAATNGVEISSVVSGSPAAGAGLAEGDVITGVAGHSVTSQSSLETVMVNDVKPGQTVTVQYTDTAGQSQTVSLVLASGPPS